MMYHMKKRKDKTQSKSENIKNHKKNQEKLKNYFFFPDIFSN